MTPTASATMTENGMRCPSCDKKLLQVDPSLTSAAGAMPGKLIAVIILMIISILLSVLTFSLISAGVGVALLVGIFLGSDGARKFVIGLVWVDLMIKIGLFAFAVIMSSGQVDMLFYLIAGVSIGISGFIIWALAQNDVRDWMFKTAFKDGM